MRVRVVEELCQGHTLCASVAPDVFHLRDDDGHSYVLTDEVPLEFHEQVRAAELGCPERAIVIDASDAETLRHP